MFEVKSTITRRSFLESLSKRSGETFFDPKSVRFRKRIVFLSASGLLSQLPSYRSRPLIDPAKINKLLRLKWPNLICRTTHSKPLSRFSSSLLPFSINNLLPASFLGLIKRNRELWPSESLVVTLLPNRFVNLLMSSENAISHYKRKVMNTNRLKTISFLESAS